MARVKALEHAVVTIDPDQCKGCELCVIACPEHVLEMSPELNRRGFHFSRYIGSGCTGCGFCYYTCPEAGAITVYKKGYTPEGEEEAPWPES
ncbi:MAG: hypothetical protein AMJ46_07690 [Latescibacteria bacterium DG_63]|jgi:NAD-dependent dihydropyrimidine dehydrogenase PreA subunit|uniref:4Fe-4S ferredoxin-type domain-containing protein n=2 Tax=Bacteria division TA06 TaxID=1156500 RepID=A0A0S8JQ72_UNCT6|nr:MAG: hypothetical protein AMJ46_07690 [Latescibacteria bacterium DG_63]KPK69529.1 MAG: hypothetical protein AMJ82_05250 [candidate division TA06 bacterium SM23_40]KPL10782.1 MAG: hypothetical protein AMJ71_01940 [candidate division TA06 bacterium SM1_40]